ncbi:MlaD family protein [Zobellella aerophila]|uniref:MlaD family protein n=1 Tax=Zobellella aerophila TaxID=870480 RepID=A0ABP6VB21_9GAMM
MQGAEPVIRKHHRFSPIWLLPLLAVLLAGSFLYQQFSQAGTTIEIHFDKANGIVPNKTLVQYQGVEVGQVQDIRLADSGRGVAVEVRIDHHAHHLLTSDTQFWLVSPKASLTEISGLDALVSGNYINMQPGTADDAKARQFRALDNPPVGYGIDGKLIRLKTGHLDSLSVGSPVYFRGVNVGNINNVRLSDEQDGVILELNIQPGYQGLVRTDSRFWNVSGIKAKLGPSGIEVETASVAALLAGGIAFDAPADSAEADSGSTFTLYANLDAARRGVRIKLQANQGVTLKTGMGIYYRGLEVGRITRVNVGAEGSLDVRALIDPEHAFRITDNSRLRLVRPALGDGLLENLPDLFSGPRLLLDYEPGEPAKIVKVTQGNLDNVHLLTLQTDTLAGISEQAPVVFKGQTVGYVAEARLKSDGQAHLRLAIEEQYVAFLPKARFYRLSPLNVQASIEGLSVQAAPLTTWLKGGIGLVLSDSSSDQLFADERAASRTAPFVEWKLETDEADGLQVGTPVYHRGLKAGEIRSIRPHSRGISLVLAIEPEYQDRLDTRAIFWRLPALDAKVGLDGARVILPNLSRLLAGGLAFDRHPRLRKQAHWLYPDQEEALAHRVSVSFIADHSLGIKAGAPIRHLGLEIGRINQLWLSSDLEQVQFLGEIDGRYATQFLNQGSRFVVENLSLSLSGAKNLDSIWRGAFIAATPGQGKPRETFILSEQAPASGQLITLTSADSHNLNIGSPVYFRRVKVGQVSQIRLARDGSHVAIALDIEPAYHHLVREGSRFWNVSGVRAELGLTGAEIEFSSLESLATGGIAFNTPPDAGPVMPAGSRFTLYPEARKDWQAWDPVFAP